jgi:hypothetical protein
VPSAGILTPVMVTGGGSGDGSSFQPRKDQIKANIAKVGDEVEDKDDRRRPYVAGVSTLVRDLRHKVPGIRTEEPSDRHDPGQARQR